jgi:hypothetical protein
MVTKPYIPLRALAELPSASLELHSMGLDNQGQVKTDEIFTFVTQQLQGALQDRSYYITTLQKQIHIMYSLTGCCT